MNALAIIEVLDKLPSVAELWGRALLCGVVGFLVCERWPRRAVAVVVLMLAAAVAWSTVAILADAHVGPAARREGGASYVVSIIGAALVTLLLPIIGLLARCGRASRGIE